MATARAEQSRFPAQTQTPLDKFRSAEYGSNMVHQFSQDGASMGLIRLGNKPPLTVTPDETVFRAACAMTERQVGAATVLDGTRVAGVLTERDVVRKIVVTNSDPNVTLVRDIMSSPVVSVSLKTSVAAAAALMREHHIRHLVVLDERENLVGMLALRYVLYALLDDMERDVGDLIGYIMIDGPGG